MWNLNTASVPTILQFHSSRLWNTICFTIECVDVHDIFTGEQVVCFSIFVCRIHHWLWVLRVFQTKCMTKLMCSYHIQVKPWRRKKERKLFLVPSVLLCYLSMSYLSNLWTQPSMLQLHQNERPHRCRPLGQKHGPVCRLDHQRGRSRHVLGFIAE